MFINPYQNFTEADIPLRANFHTHAGTGRRTCGFHRLKDVLQNYQRTGYQILCISNHNCNIKKIGKMIFPDPLKFRHYAKDLMQVPGFEYSFTPHVVVVGTKEFLNKDGLHQEAIDLAVNAGGFAVLAHPHWLRDDYLTKENMEKFRGYAGIEVLNGSMEYARCVFQERENKCYAGDVLDYLLSKGLLKWAFANDDFHRWNHLANAWNMIYCKKTPEDLYRAVRQGEFYASTGVSLSYLRLENGVISMACRNGEYVKEPMRYRFIGFEGKLLQETEGTEASYTLRGDEKYVRVEVVSPSGTMLITNPVYDDAFFRK